MEQYITPTGQAGSDQIDAMIESVQSELEQMFFQFAKLKSIIHGVGRTGMTSDGPDSKIKLDAQKRECQAQTASHGGRAVELAMHILYARGMDRILGREFPGVSSNQMKKDRKSHSLKSLYDRICNEFDGRDMQEALEDVYQRTLHSGAIDLYIDGELIETFWFLNNVPFREVVKKAVIEDAEMTFDHLDGLGSLFGNQADGNSAFSKLPDSFASFLVKADAAYYERDTDGTRRNIRWMIYNARDHEYARPYVTIGDVFFGRLVKGILGLANEQWTWNDGFKERWHERRQSIIGKLVERHIGQNYKQSIELPEMNTIEDAIQVLDQPPTNYPRNYDIHHNKLELKTKEGGHAG